MRDSLREIVLFSGSAHPELARAVAGELGIELSPTRTSRFSNDCLEVQLEANCRQRDVYVVQPLVPPVQEALVELLLMVDAAKHASAGRVTAVVPHYAYARSDKKDTGRISIGGRLVADLLETAGADHVLAVTLHSPQVHGFFRVPVDHLHALHQLATHFAGEDLSNAVVVSPDLGYAKPAAAFARLLGCSVAAGAKQRFPDDRVVIADIIGEVTGKDVIVIDDEIAKGSTVFELVARLKELRVRSVRVVCTHGIFAGDALDRLIKHPDIDEVVCTDTVPLRGGPRPGLSVISIAPALATAIRHIHEGESVSALFQH
ncbi:ribose-phosphate pyrophosphokinase [Kineococcus radiotolerans]|uniref:ribose-phosphate diphosphokinase n=1 Tax=Kineococcus radiotolerans TaxID=131568 RepID=A0A7W4TLP0_KINRA|nr:ribose-phosphate pyrophosphokinase [Kineococcus radiotolerans]MBB2901214.1 ribose-phosphate pyrophosphokinase [Kineococcus radiotolerans]